MVAAFGTVQTVVPALMYFSCNVSFASLPVFLPAILGAMGFSDSSRQGLTAPPYFASFLICIATTWLSDRLRQRGLTIAVLSLVAGVGYVLLATVESVAVRYLGVFLAAGGVFPAIANILPWVLNNQGTDTKRGVGIAVLNLVGQCGPVLGTRLFPAADKPFFVKGMAVCAAFMFFNAALAGGLRWHLKRMNRRLDEAEQAAGAGPADVGAGYGQSEMEGSAGYRFVL